MMRRASTTTLVILGLVSVVFSSPPVIYLGYQDSFGQYTFGYSTPESSRSEIRLANGLTRGAFSYIDELGVIQSAQYEAGDDGFRIAATNLPQAPLPVQDTPEVTAARIQHLKALEFAAHQESESSDSGSLDSRKSEMGGISSTRDSPVEGHDQPQRFGIVDGTARIMTRGKRSPSRNANRNRHPYRNPHRNPNRNPSRNPRGF